MYLAGLPRHKNFGNGQFNPVTDHRTCHRSLFQAYGNGCPHDGRADKNPYPHNRRANKDSYLHVYFIGLCMNFHPTSVKNTGMCIHHFINADIESTKLRITL